MDEDELSRKPYRCLRPGDPWPADDSLLPTIDRLKTCDDISQEEVDEFIAFIRRMRREDLERESPRFLRLRRPKMVLVK
jgi:hypothetical protein